MFNTRERFYLLIFLACMQPQEQMACFGPTYLQLQALIKDHFYDMFFTIIPKPLTALSN